VGSRVFDKEADCPAAFAVASANRQVVNSFDNITYVLYKDTGVNVMPKMSCLLCGSSVELKTSKKNKPYYVCNACGLQVFTRQEHSASLIVEKAKTYRKGG
jgi:DNA-directed RNA polymerase subunit RPC12/RpoP